MKRVIVTGAAGFIGSHLTEELINQGIDVIAIDNESFGKKENLDEAFLISKKENKGSLVYLKEDILNNTLKEILKKYTPIDCIFHEAAIGSVPRSIDDPKTSFENNIIGTLNILLIAKELKIKRIIFASSSSVYGDDNSLPKVEEKTGKVLSPYALTKKVNEENFELFYKLYGIESVCLRYFNVFGPRQNPEGQYAAVIPKFIRLILEDKQPIIFGDGEQTRDFTYVKNVVDANLLFAKLPKEKVCGKVFNIACGERISVNQLVKKINEILGKNIKPIYEKERIGDVKHSLADISKAKELGFKPSISFKEGLIKTIEYFKSH